MTTRNGSVLVKAVVGILALGAAGAGAFHLAGGCPLGLCDSAKKDSARVTTVSIESGEGSCCRDGGAVAARFVTTEAAFFEEGTTDVLMASCDETASMICCELKDGEKADKVDGSQTASNAGK